MRMLIAALLTLALTGCGAATSTVGAGPADEVPAEAAPADLRFTATTLEGERFEGASLEGRPTVLWFWAPWCLTCRSQIATVSGLGAEYAGEVNVVGVGGLDAQGEIEALAGQIDDVTHLVDEQGTVWRHFGVTAQSTYTVIDADGEVRHEGYLDDAALEDLVAELAG